MIVFHRTSSFFLDDGVSIEMRVYPQAHNFNTIIKWIMDEIVFIGVFVFMHHSGIIKCNYHNKSNFRC